MPDIVSTAGRAGKTITAACDAQRDEFSEASYWWLVHENGSEDLRKLEREFMAGRERTQRKGFTEECLNRVLESLES